VVNKGYIYILTIQIAKQTEQTKIFYSMQLRAHLVKDAVSRQLLILFKLYCISVSYIN